MFSYEIQVCSVESFSKIKTMPDKVVGVQARLPRALHLEGVDQLFPPLPLPFLTYPLVFRPIG